MKAMLSGQRMFWYPLLWGLEQSCSILVTSTVQIFTLNKGWPEPYICIVYDCMYCDCPAKTTLITPYTLINVWLALLKTLGDYCHSMSYYAHKWWTIYLDLSKSKPTQVWYQSSQMLIMKHHLIAVFVPGLTETPAPLTAQLLLEPCSPWNG